MNATEKMLRVLAIEDSEDDFELIRNELAEGGFTIQHERVETAETLKSAIQQQIWDMVICDHNLPSLDSISALKIVHGIAKDVPFIIVSGLIPDEVAIEAMRHGARDFIRKDNLTKLVAVVERELKESVLRTDLKMMREDFHRVSHFDSLTGLPNREYLFKHLRALMRDKDDSGGGDNQAGDNQAFAVFLIDLNRFRQVTKSLGMWAGNKVLVETAERLCAALCKEDFIARLGADRFVAVVPGLEHEAGASEIAATIHQCMDDAFQINGQELFVKTSVGVSFYPGDGQEWDDLLKNAESALYSAKAAGGSSYKAYKPEMDNQGKQRLIMESALYHALAQKELALQYQPQFDLFSGRIIGAEALIRWHHPEFGLILPAEFIPLLEETGLIVPVGEWVLRTACAQNKQWQDAGLPPIRVAVNLSVIQFRQPGLADMIRRILEETGLSPEYLELEITENIALHTEEIAIGILDELRAIGIQIAIDDFGTGYSSLSYLKRFPIDKLKIDQSFVRDHKAGVNDDGIVMAIISMGHSLKLKVIAEGVETQDQVDFLRQNGCDEVQGFFYGKPMKDRDIAFLMTHATAANEPCCDV
ncbi:MAG: GGDEF domain-containing response regulator [Nitrosomonadales bacterium]|nr:GGDEF domain-containing response regulator [Nitrosomonadales bacterium]